ncbi:hypothetical protein [Paenibacillus sp. MMS20-IR301]|uniref:hypothetical protein n=1 Tax=Paenibacillus sp. MMS20-IR301 TaxID=2895946 RepID=UPI0028EB956E|nr:hypothetical protein [Paenibacillus sp. MMS20-IR301]WNS40955.1 hypothetical protein LOS79_18070 [Paenibacillus sp. MMS20-IR301]
MPLLFHPTVFDNIKIALENQIYDYDNLDGILMVTDRSDVLDLALMSREFSLAFKLTEGHNVTSEIVLKSSVKELSEEILAAPGANPGCILLLRFYMEIEDVNEQCPAIEKLLISIWGPDFQPVQSLSFRYGQGNDTYNCCIELQFKRQITEDQMEDLPNLLQFLLQSAGELEEV